MLTKDLFSSYFNNLQLEEKIENHEFYLNCSPAVK